MASPDPVADPQAYQKMLLELVGDDDPAEVQAATPGAIRTLIARAGDRLRLRPEPKEWSVLECLGHVMQAEIVFAGRYRWIVAHDGPPMIGYDQDLWVDRLRVNDEDPQRLLAMFEALRSANIHFWQHTSDEERDRVGIHSERGPESLDMSFRLIAGHDRFHLRQAERTIAALP